MVDAYAVMSEVMGCLCEKVAETPAGSPCFCGMLPGASVFPLDACACDRGGARCGTAWVRLDGVFPSRVFPVPDTQPTTCGSPLAFRLHVGVVRCVPGLDIEGNGPTVADQLKAVEQETADMRAAQQAVSCCVAKKGRNVILGTWQALGAPDGHCTGGVWPVTIWEVGW